MSSRKLLSQFVKTTFATAATSEIFDRTNKWQKQHTGVTLPTPKTPPPKTFVDLSAEITAAAIRNRYSQKD